MCCIALCMEILLPQTRYYVIFCAKLTGNRFGGGGGGGCLLSQACIYACICILK